MREGVLDPTGIEELSGDSVDVEGALWPVQIRRFSRRTFGEVVVDGWSPPTRGTCCGKASAISISVEALLVRPCAVDLGPKLLGYWLAG
ncbi:hypothetical protein ASF53_11205 [Methylobacterium sp. Leaf123]|nr:hypothetical protein ASF53_11205 [Methylobacterium sp. Leaf123]